MSGERYNIGKLRWALVWFPAVEEMLQVLEAGAIKYAPENWKKGLHEQETLESTMRHLVALFNGEYRDPETGLPHWAHIMCNMMFFSFHHRHKSFTTERNNPFKNKQNK